MRILGPATNFGNGQGHHGSRLTLISGLSHQLLLNGLHRTGTIGQLGRAMTADGGTVKEGTGEAMVAGVSVGGDKDAGYNRLRMIHLGGLRLLVEICIRGCLFSMRRRGTSVAKSLPKLLIFSHQVSDPGFGWPRWVR